ncbi:uncharacterized protein LODBEIA_P60500 [Lodderomyces beijingensis]|uniref:Maf-like protein n=1 Tax=Lodderomyces beijingensis TaxID=1775926 RepID=A0ABP0ZW64_9ASCO
MAFNERLKGLDEYGIILGSNSPRRREIMERNFGFENFQVMKSNFEEDLDQRGLTPLEYVKRTCQCKAEDLLATIEQEQRYCNENVVLLTCDTIVSCNGKIHEKPESRQEQVAMLAEYSRHPDLEVISAVSVYVIRRGVNIPRLELHDHCVTKLHFKSDNEDVVQAYVVSGEGLSVAGGFKYQEKGCLLFDEIEGDYYNVVGLPTIAYTMLAKALAN